MGEDKLDYPRRGDYFSGVPLSGAGAAECRQAETLKTPESSDNQKNDGAMLGRS